MMVVATPGMQTLQRWNYAGCCRSFFAGEICQEVCKFITEGGSPHLIQHIQLFFGSILCHEFCRHTTEKHSQSALRHIQYVF